MLLLSLLLLTSTPGPVAPWATGDSKGEDLSIKVVTFGPGDDITEWFGHAAVVVEDKRLHVSRLYNYGEYSFDETLVRRYVMGHLEFSVGERSVEKTLALYAGHDRDVRLQELALTAAQKAHMARLLADNVKPENRRYLYDHYADNCTTRIRDVIDVVTAGQLHAQTAAAGTRTLRQLTREKTAVSPGVAFVIDLILNSSTDRPLALWQEAFLPEEFEQQLARVTLTDETGTHLLVTGNSTYWKSTRETPAPKPLSTSVFFIVGLFCAAFVVGLRKQRIVFGLVVALFGFTAGSIGTVLFAMAFFTDHHVTWGNFNLLFVSPLTLLLVPAGIAHAAGKRGLDAVAVVVVVAAVVGVVAGLVGAQDITWQLAVLVPLWIAVAVGARAAIDRRGGR